MTIKSDFFINNRILTKKKANIKKLRRIDTPYQISECRKGAG